VNTFNNALQSYSTNLNTFQQNQNNLYNRLAGTSSLGAGTQNSLNALLQSGAGTQSGVDLATGQGIAPQQNLAAAAQAGGVMGANNAWQNSLGGIFGGLQDFAGSTNLFGQGAGSSLNQSGNSFLNMLGNLGNIL
jgi:hypothetical protein